MHLVTTYVNPDLDGIASAIAYAELKNYQAGFFGTPSPEAAYVLSYLNLPLPRATVWDKVILVDESNLSEIITHVKVEDIIEVFDHRKVHEAEKFVYAKSHIELVGSCATLIAEKIKNPSRTTAFLLYTAIVSNTINFNAKVTTDRDRKAAAFLEPFANIPEDFIKKMFIHKSIIEDIPKAIALDYLLKSFQNITVGVAQLELVDAEAFYKKNESLIHETIEKLGKNHYVRFLSIIDVEKGYTLFITSDDQTKNILQQSLNLTFKNNRARYEGIYLRKEYMPLIYEFLSKVLKAS